MYCPWALHIVSEKKKKILYPIPEDVITNYNEIDLSFFYYIRAYEDFYLILPNNLIKSKNLGL